MEEKTNQYQISKQFYEADPREFPIYGLKEASHYLKTNVQTLAFWLKGRNYKLKNGKIKFWEPLIKPARINPIRLSFYNLVEIHMLLAFRRNYKIQFRKVRSTLLYLKEKYKSEPHPLVTQEFWTNHIDLFIRNAGTPVCTSNSEQQYLLGVVDQYLTRIDRDESRLPARIYPMPIDSSEHQKKWQPQEKIIVIDPNISFGNPSISGRGISTKILAGRFKAGESILSITEDYGITKEETKAALIFEELLPRAA